MRKAFHRLLVTAFIVMLLAPAADAARLGGGRSSSGARPSAPVAPMPRQAPTLPPSSAVPQQPGPGQQAPAPLPQQQIPRQAPAPQPSRFGGVGGFLGGMLAGGLLGSLFFGGSHGVGAGGGGGGGFGFLFDILLIGGAAWLLYRFVIRRKHRQEEPLTSPPSERSSYTPPQGSPDPWDNLRTEPQARQDTPPTAADYGFGQAPQPGAAGQSAPAVDLPPGFNAEEFIKGAKAVYVRLQSSWDRRDLKDLESFCAPAMLKDIKEQAAADPKPGRTDILMLEATLAAVNREGDNTVASVVFDAQLRENMQEGLKDVRELWHFIRDESKTGANWVLYGIEQVQ